MSSVFSFHYHRFDVPLDWNNADSSPTISLAVREVIDKDGEGKPPLLFLQGGPGFGVRFPTDDKWILELQKRFRVFLLDQRGTGLSTPIDITSVIDIDTHDRNEAIAYLTHFRADSIARDVEHIRLSLFSDENFYTYGQSFGGWCTHAYLSLFPNSPTACLLTGGFPGIGHGPLESYRELLPQVDRSNAIFLDKYPETKTQLEHLMKNLDPDTLLSLAQYGFNSGYASSHGDLRAVIESLYFELETLGRPSLGSLRKMYDPLGFINNPLYALLHEPLYCEGIAPNWAADTVMLKENGRPSTSEVSQFFLAENVFRSYFRDVSELVPLAGLMDALMAYSDWGQLYNIENLSQCEAPVIGVVYKNDAAVVTSFSQETAALLGNGHVINSDLDHNANRAEPEKIFGELFTKLDEVTA